MAYPSDIDTFREKENMPGVVYDETKKQVFFMEDLGFLESAIIAIETWLGTALELMVIPVNGWIPYFYGLLRKIWTGSVDLKTTIPFTFPAGLAIPSTGLHPLPAARCTALASGGHFGIRHGMTFTVYDIHIVYEYAAPANHTLWFQYLNNTTRAYVAPPTAALGDIISGDTNISYRLTTAEV